ncbi:MAG TPA: transglycosylase family protein [Acidimicrobiales bacterium]
MRKRVLILLLPLAGCSTSQVDAWIDWWEDDPKAAVEWAREECGALCTDDWDRDGVVEPEPDGDGGGESSADSASSDEAVESASSDQPDHGGDADTAGIYWPWNELAECESGGNWGISTGNGYYGGLQFSLSSWHAAGGSGYPHEHSASEQIARGEVLQDMQGWGAWPTCARVVGLL